MPAYSNPAAEEDMYSDAQPAPEKESPEAPEPESKDEGEGGEAEALLPKSILAGKDFKPGEEIVLQIVSIEDDSVRVKYASESKEETESESPELAGPAPTPDEMGSMME